MNVSEILKHLEDELSDLKEWRQLNDKHKAVDFSCGYAECLQDIVDYIKEKSE